MEDRHKKIVYIVALAAFFLVMVFIGIYVGGPLIQFVREPEKFRAWVDSYGIWGRLLFLGIVIFQVLVAFVPGEPVELAAGYIFGWIEGSVLSMLGFLIGSWIIFVLVRRFGVKLVEVFFTKDQIHQVQFLKNPKKTKAVAFILMTIPGTPKDFLSYFAGLTSMTLKQWLGIVSISRLPSLISSTVSGAAAGEKQYILSFVLIAITGIFSIAGVLYYRWVCKQENKSAEPD